MKTIDLYLFVCKIVLIGVLRLKVCVISHMLIIGISWLRTWLQLLPT